MPSFELPLEYAETIPLSGLFDAKGERVAVSDGSDFSAVSTEANMAFLARAANYHERLLEAIDVTETAHVAAVHDCYGEVSGQNLESAIAALVTLAKEVRK